MISWDESTAIGDIGYRDIRTFASAAIARHVVQSTVYIKLEVQFYD